MADKTSKYTVLLEFLADKAQAGVEHVEKALTGAAKALEALRNKASSVFSAMGKAARKAGSAIAAMGKGIFNLKNGLIALFSGALLDRFLMAGEELTRIRAQLAAIPGATQESAEQLYTLLTQIQMRTGRSLEEMTRAVSKAMSDPLGLTSVGEVIGTVIRPEVVKAAQDVTALGRTDLYHQLVTGLLADRVRELATAAGEGTTQYASMKMQFQQLLAEVSAIAGMALSPLFAGIAAKFAEWRQKARDSSAGIVHWFQVTLMGWLDTAYQTALKIILKLQWAFEGNVAQFKYIADTIGYLATFDLKKMGFGGERPQQPQPWNWPDYFSKHGGWEEALGGPTPFANLMRQGGTSTQPVTGPSGQGILAQIMALLGGGQAGEAAPAGTQSTKLMTSLRSVSTKVTKQASQAVEGIKRDWMGALDQIGQSSMRVLMNIEDGLGAMIERLGKELLASTFWKLLLYIITSLITGGTGGTGGAVEGAKFGGGIKEALGSQTGKITQAAMGSGNNFTPTVIHMHETTPATWAQINRTAIYPSTRRIVQRTTRQLGKQLTGGGLGPAYT